ncbi:aspartate kinase [Candidatus Omnitrophota bacterium]
MRKELVVQKFGGTSVADVERIKEVAKRVASYKHKGHHLVVVVSALGGSTDELIKLAEQITKKPPEREMDMLMATGEQISCALLAMAIEELGYDAIAFTGGQVGIITDRIHTKARIVRIDAKRIREALKKDQVVIVAGFQGITRNADITTLGRGGSDLTAVALAKTLNADVCEIYTDVEGIFSADPRIDRKSRKIHYITYDEMLEMASLGAQVMQARSIELAKRFNISIHVRSSFSTKEGTMIVKESKKMEEVVVRGVTLNKKEAKLTICDVPDRPGIAGKIFGEISKAGVNVDMIVQNVSHTRQTDISFTVPKSHLDKALKISKKVSSQIKAGAVLKDANVARISIVGVGMKSHPGIAAKMFKVLAENKINIEMISTSEISISCIIKRKFGNQAVKALNRKFNLIKR